MAAERVSAGHRSCSAGLASDAAGAIGRGLEMGGGADQCIGLRLEVVRGRAVEAGAGGGSEQERSGGVFERGGALGKRRAAAGRGA